MMVILQYLLLAAGIALLAWGYRHNLRNRMLGGALVLFLAGIAPDLADGFGAPGHGDGVAADVDGDVRRDVDAVVACHLIRDGGGGEPDHETGRKYGGRGEHCLTHVSGMTFR